MATVSVRHIADAVDAAIVFSTRQDPSGAPIELFEPTLPEASLSGDR